MLKLNEKLEKINTALKTVNNSKNWYKIELTEKNKILKISKNTLSTLQENGIELEKTYLSYNNSPVAYNAILEVLKNNTDIFTLRG